MLAGLFELVWVGLVYAVIKAGFVGYAWAGDFGAAAASGAALGLLYELLFAPGRR